MWASRGDAVTRPGRRGRALISVVAVLAALAAWPSAAGAQARAIGDTRVFAKGPDPGQPAGIVVDQGRVLVSTAGVFQPSMDPRLFVYDLAARKLSASHDIPLDHAQMGAVGQHPVMTFFGVADDAAGRAYVVDMNGRIIRVDPVTGPHEDYATFPASVGGLSTMPFDIAFDDPGNAYVTDQNTASIWRVPPGGGTPKIWFQDPRLAGYLFGASGIRLDPQGRYVYFTVSLSQYPETSNAGVVYRLPLVDHPTAAQLQEVYRYPSGSMPFGIAFGASGKLYVALAGLDQVSILQPSGSGPAMKEAKVFPSAEENSSRDVPYEDPMSVAFDGCGSLLVTNSTALTPPSNPAHWAIFDAWVGDTAAPMARPALPGAAPLPVHSPPCAPPPVNPPPLPTLPCLARYLPLDATGIGAVRIGETRRRML